MLNVKQVAEKLAIAERTARDLLQRGKLCRFVRVGRAIRVDAAELDRWIEDSTEAGAVCQGGVRWIGPK